MRLTVHATPHAAARWLAGAGVRALSADHRRVGAGDAFLAWPGRRVDARAHVADALRAGAAVCLVEAEGVEGFGFDAGVDGTRVAAMPGLKARAGEVASAFLGEPSARLDVVAITGTNGKTSTAWWTAQALSALGRRCGVVGTLGVGEPGRLDDTGLTTPDALALQAAFHRFAEAGFAASAIEASSIGLVEGRLAGTRIAVGVFTNLTRDHLDYHGTMEAYGEAKASLFAWPGLRAAVIDVDDAFGAALAQRVAARQDVALWTVAARDSSARLRAEGVRHAAAGLAFELAEGALSLPVQTALVGHFNVRNLLAVAGALRALGVPLAEVARVLAGLGPVPGRLQRVTAPAGASAQAAAGPEVVVDYAHTPDALAQVLSALRPLAESRGGALWCVFGCGGNRDATKRPLMGAAAAQGADHVVVTSDNPRDEDPQAIVAQVLAGLPAGRAQAVVDRAEAIARAVAAAGPRDVVLIAGKGHETTQETAGEKRPFSDVEHAAAALARRLGVPASGAPAREAVSP